MPTNTGTTVTAAESVREQERLYKLIIGQLRSDKYENVAHDLTMTLKNATGGSMMVSAPTNRLQELVRLGLRHEEIMLDTENHSKKLEKSANIGAGLDLEYDTEDMNSSPTIIQYETAYVTSHKAPTRVACFTPDGKLCATGSVDASLKIMDVERMVHKSQQQQNNQHVENHPVIRTLYDHLDSITALSFHPVTTHLVSGSKDCTVKIFDFTKASVKKAIKSVDEGAAIRCMSFHQSGDYLLIANDHPVIRMYDYETLKCFVASNNLSQHKSSVLALCWNSDATMYASCSSDGSIKLWDGVSSRCVRTVDDAHSGAEVTSIQFSRNGKYILSSGKDSNVKLWEVTSGHVLNEYVGVTQHNHRTGACFNHTEDLIIAPDEKGMAIGCWDARTAEPHPHLVSGHNNVVRGAIHSPTMPAFISCSDDFRARFWYYRGI